MAAAAPVTSAPASLQPLAGDQALASEPGAHVWLSASAGTGKTHVLTARVYRLLLGGVRPENILCLTFTKAGAAEMAERIHTRLAEWVQMDGPTLALDLKALGEDFGPEAQARARRLFAEVLEATGGGLRIQTIHSFCQQLLTAFPVEAGLAPGFRPLDDRARRDLARQALAELVVEAEARGDTRLIEAMRTLSLRTGEAGAEAFLMKCAASQQALAALPDDVEGWLRSALELPEGDVDAAIAAECGDDCFDITTLRWVAARNADWSTARAIARCDVISRWLAGDLARRASMLGELNGCWAKADGTLTSTGKGWAPQIDGYLDAVTRLHEVCAGLMVLRDRVAYAAMLGQALHAGRAYAAAYAEAKRNAGAVDFDDLIARAVTLLLEDGMAGWIRYKLDQQTDHILVDEAQDTNTRQWQIVGALAAEFFAGEGARGDRLRTIFTVGDFKQAIFGFQGTSPLAFEAARRAFQAQAHDAGHDFHDLSLDRSFRSTPAVLDIVDATLRILAPEGLGLSDEAPAHISANVFPGEVQLWKPVAAMTEADMDAEGEEDWLADQERMLAERIATQIKAWIDDGLMLESKGRPIGPGDIMILVRRRSDLARLIVARLYEKQVPIAGIDRLRLNAPLAVRDLLAALRFAVQPEDDLNLANLLVSPLIGWTQDDLLARAVREKGGLWAHLRATLADEEIAPLRAMLGVADLMTPYYYLEHLLSGPLGGRRKLLLRLGAEARDPIEELLNAALAFEGEGQASLQRFIDWFDRGDVDIVRDPAAVSDAVRLLTVHGAKGLQAPVVILADATADPDKTPRADALLWDGLPVVPPRKAERFGPIGERAEAKAREDREEHGRLLYVAVTRAEERLLVAGSLPPRAKGVVPPASWYASVEAAMEGLGAGWDADPLWGARRCWRGREVLSPRKPAPRDAALREDIALPLWLRAPAPVEARPPRPLAPSAPVEDAVPNPPPSADYRKAAERGRWIHGLFERLPALVPADRAAAADAWLARIARVDDPRERQALAAHVLDIVEHPDFAALFSPEGLTEAPIAAVVGGAVIAGTVDRLLVLPDRVQVVDFKTGRCVPDGPTDVPVPHVRQMAAYAAALEAIFPDRPVEAALLYTSGPSLIALPAALLAPHKPGFAATQDNL